MEGILETDAEKCLFAMRYFETKTVWSCCFYLPVLCMYLSVNYRYVLCISFSCRKLKNQVIGNNKNKRLALSIEVAARYSDYIVTEVRNFKNNLSFSLFIAFF